VPPPRKVDQGYGKLAVAVKTIPLEGLREEIRMLKVRGHMHYPKFLPLNTLFANKMVTSVNVLAVCGRDPGCRLGEAHPHCPHKRPTVQATCTNTRIHLGKKLHQPPRGKIASFTPLPLATYVPSLRRGERHTSLRPRE